MTLLDSIIQWAGTAVWVTGFAVLASAAMLGGAALLFAMQAIFISLVTTTAGRFGNTIENLNLAREWRAAGKPRWKRTVTGSGVDRKHHSEMVTEDEGSEG